VLSVFHVYVLNLVLSPDLHVSYLAP